MSANTPSQLSASPPESEASEEPGKRLTRGKSEDAVLARFDAMVGPLPKDVRKALYYHICAAISEELMTSGHAFLPTLGWLTVNTIPQENGSMVVRPSFKASRDLKEEIRKQALDAVGEGAERQQSPGDDTEESN
ncbi:hypothetical protein [Halomonas sp. I5-271120]|uniref:hypothetical protein n=1 Tax=Halomonas sp. I5-271120 TaxID=3061632 RepID=UPI002714FDA8|nr:hypothetical protein [Halomonas sp. I5-271120]